VGCPKCEGLVAEPGGKAQKFIVRNAIVEHMDTVVAHPWRDPKTNKKISGATVFLVLLAMAKHVWSELGHCTAGNTALAISAGVSADYVPLAKRAAAQLDVIKYVGESRLGTDTYAMSVGFIEEFVERARLPVPEILKEFRRLNPDPKKLAAEDAAEEEQMMEAEDAEESGLLEDAVYTEGGALETVPSR
jgi:hypothetical protein